MSTVRQVALSSGWVRFEVHEDGCSEGCDPRYSQYIPEEKKAVLDAATNERGFGRLPGFGIRKPHGLCAMVRGRSCVVYEMDVDAPTNAGFSILPVTRY